MEGVDGGRRGPDYLDEAAPFPASTTSDREQPSAPAAMNCGLAQRVAKCRRYVQRLIRFSLARVVLPDKGELQLRRLTVASIDDGYEFFQLQEDLSEKLNPSGLYSLSAVPLKVE